MNPEAPSVEASHEIAGPAAGVASGDWLGVFVMPRRIGLWEMVCGENGYKAERVAITRKAGVLTVHCPDIGALPLRRYHDGLTCINWRFIA